MLIVNSVSKNYGKFTALENINLEFNYGVHALLAPNGAGKTTLMKLISTLLYPTSGNILYDGTEIYKLEEDYRKIIGYLPQNFGYYKDYTAKAYLNYLAALKGLKRKDAYDKVEELLELTGLTAEKNKKLKKFSGGMIQRVGIAQTLLNDPKILILDEPTAGLDPKECVRFRNIISSISRDKIIILSTHIISDIESIANRIIMLKDKHAIYNDTKEYICNSLYGKVYISKVDQEGLEYIKKNFFLLTQKQEDKFVHARYVSMHKDDIPNSESVNPTLEDVFLYTYRT